MKGLSIYKQFFCIAWAVCSLFVTAAAVSPDDPAVMSRIVVADMAPIPMRDPVDTGTLLLSDSPEYPDGPGILYGDKVNGDCRMYFYHMNQSDQAQKIVVIAYNPGDKPVDAVVKGYEYARPNSSIYAVGKELSMMYYEGTRSVNKVRVEPRSYALLGDRLDKIPVWPGQLFSALVDVETPSPLYISAVMVPFYQDPLEFVRRQIYLPSDEVKMRGTFAGKDRRLKSFVPYAPQDGISCIKIGDGQGDAFMQGRDVMDNRPSENTGNYGVDYTIELRTKGEGNLHLFFNPLGGEYAGVVELVYDKGTATESRKIVELPASGLSMGKNTPYSIQHVDTFAAGKTVTIHFMPPGAANLPVRFIIVPDKELQAMGK